MKHRIILALCLVAFGRGFAQNEGWLKEKTQDSRLNFAVPDAPAFVILGDNPSVAIRPSTVQELTLAVGEFARSGGVLPRLFGAELSPGLLVGGKTLTLGEYNDKPFLYRARVSLAARRFDDGSGRTQASLGVRLTLHDESDPRADKGFTNELSKLALRINTLARGVQELGPPVSSGRIEVPTAGALEQQVEQLRSKQKDSLWNAGVMECAVAVRFLSSDSVAKNAQVDKYSGWFAASFPVSRWGQFLFSLSGGLERKPVGRFDSGYVAMNGRFYYGSNDIKGFAEAQFMAVGDDPTHALINLGGEFNPLSSFWAEFSVGLEKVGRDLSFIRTSFKVRWSLPEMRLPS